VFNGGGDHMALGCARRDRPEDCEVVRFSATPGEDDFGGLGADEGGDAFAGVFDARTRALAGGMNRASVAKLGGEIRRHRGQNRRVYRRSGIKVEINAQGEGSEIPE